MKLNPLSVIKSRRTRLLSVTALVIIVTVALVLPGYLGRTAVESARRTQSSSSQSNVAYSRVVQFSTFCGATPTDTVNYGTGLGNLTYDPSAVGNANHYEESDVRFYFDSLGQQGCWPYSIAAKYVQVDIWIQDSSGAISWVNSNGQLVWSGRPVIPGSGWTVNYDFANRDQGQGLKHVGWFRYSWPSQPKAAYDVLVPIVITDQLAQTHSGDPVQVKIAVTATFDSFGCGWWGWCGDERTINDVYTLNSTLTAQ